MIVFGRALRSIVILIPSDGKVLKQNQSLYHFISSHFVVITPHIHYFIMNRLSSIRTIVVIYE